MILDINHCLVDGKWKKMDLENIDGHMLQSWIFSHVYHIIQIACYRKRVKVGDKRGDYIPAKE